MNENRFFLISFLPAIAYWYLETYYTLKIALIGGLILAIIEISLEKILTKKVHKISLFNFWLILILGGISLLGEEGIWFKLQPFFTGVLMGTYFLWSTSTGKSLMAEMMPMQNDKKHALPEFVFIKLERDLGIFMICYGIFMAYIALKQETKAWLFYKTIGFYISSFVFFVFAITYFLIFP